jgi:hypothetical protein
MWPLLRCIFPDPSSLGGPAGNNMFFTATSCLKVATTHITSTLHEYEYAVTNITQPSNALWSYEYAVTNIMQLSNALRLYEYVVTK